MGKNVRLAGKGPEKIVRKSEILAEKGARKIGKIGNPLRKKTQKIENIRVLV